MTTKFSIALVIGSFVGCFSTLAEEREPDLQLAILLEQYERDRNAALAALNKRFIEKIEVRKQTLLKQKRKKDVLIADLQIKKLTEEVRSFEQGKRIRESIAGKWQFQYKGKKRIFEFEKDGTFSAQYPVSGRTFSGWWRVRAGRVELISPGEKSGSYVELTEKAGATFIGASGRQMVGTRSGA